MGSPGLVQMDVSPPSTITEQERAAVLAVLNSEGRYVPGWLVANAEDAIPVARSTSEGPQDCSTRCGTSCGTNRRRTPVMAGIRNANRRVTLGPWWSSDQASS